ncbi:hypothetical protein C2G38_2121175 [Gigaspora rosea]|uniref:Uncharacterized protein n=1 Tax=Gigaspora rosea TaxID=44941 RepID=A0A397U1X6_9GLOM|nr:hypothetical protein C2G38_2121175 [Gigaspora rosea]
MSYNTHAYKGLLNFYLLIGFIIINICCLSLKKLEEMDGFIIDKWMKSVLYYNRIIFNLFLFWL